MGANIRKVLSWAYCIGFAALAWYFLYVRNADVMYFMQDRGWWNSTRLFWQECVSVPGGVLAWTGAYLTQYFYHPAAGTSMLIALWIVIFWTAKLRFRVPEEWSFLLLVPLAALLCSIIELGYWVYILRDVDYVFYHSLGLLLALLLSTPFWEKLPVGESVKRWIGMAWIPAVAAVFYYPLGIYALLGAVLSTLRTPSASRLKGEKKKASTLMRGLEGSILLLTLFLVPLLETSGTTLMRPDQPWLYGFHKFEMDALRDYSLEVPFYIALLSPLLFPFIRRIKASRLIVSQVAMAGTFALMYGGLAVRDFTDRNFHAELRMQRAVEECRWNDVLREAALAKGPVTREMVMFRDIALINRGEFCSRHYTFNNESIQPATVSDSIHLRISNQAGDLIYYNFGETCFAIRRSIERCMHFGYSYYTMRVLTLCAMVNGETENARKYLRLLSRTTFQRPWAEKMLRLLGDEKAMAADEHFRVPMLLYNEGSENVGTDDLYVELTIMKKWMYTITDDPLAQEVALGCAMIMRDRNCFWAQVQRYYNIHHDGRFPTHVQEAMLFGVYELKMQGVNLSFVKFDQRVLDRYKAFFQRMNQYASRGMNEQQLGQALRPEFGDTYMWDYCVLREVQTN